MSELGKKKVKVVNLYTASSQTCL